MTAVLAANQPTTSRVAPTGYERVAASVWLLMAAGALSTFSGCGTTKSFTATEQLLVSDAVDSTVAQIDFRPLSGRRAFLDNTFLPTQKGVPNPNPSLVHSEYVTSSLRQQMLAAGVMLCEKREEADVIVEARMGALGFDGHTVTYGVPASSSLSTAASTLSGSPIVPLLPELSFAKKEAKSGAAKLALFAYERQTLEPVWQSGIARSSSTARDTWVLGVGPLQNGTIYEGTRFAGSRVLGKTMTRLVDHEDDEPETLVDYKRSQVFTPLSKPEPEGATAQSDASKPAEGNSSVTQASASAAAPATLSNPAAAALPTVPPAKGPTATAGPTAAATTTATPTSATAAATKPASTEPARVSGPVSGPVSVPASQAPAVLPAGTGSSASKAAAPLSGVLHIDDSRTN